MVLDPRLEAKGKERSHSFSRTPLAMLARVLFMFICIATFISHPPPLLCCGAILPCRLATSEAGFASVRLFYSIFLFWLVGLLAAICYSALSSSACEGDCDLFWHSPPSLPFPLFNLTCLIGFVPFFVSFLILSWLSDRTCVPRGSESARGTAASWASLHLARLGERGVGAERSQLPP